MALHHKLCSCSDCHTERLLEAQKAELDFEESLEVFGSKRGRQISDEEFDWLVDFLKEES